jgi:alkylhydroperoxidase family enzyme
MDIDQLRKHYTDLQALEIVFAIAGFNSTNRWKEGVGVPQEKEASRFLKNSTKPVPTDRVLPIKSFLTPTPEHYRDKVTRVAPLQTEGPAGAPSRKTIAHRPPLEKRQEVEKALADCRKRTPRLPLVTEEKARSILGAAWSKGPLPQWVRLLANFPRDGKGRITGLRAADATGDPTPLLKAQVSWIIARQDRAWYAVGEARRRLKELGWSDEQIYRLDGDWSDFTPTERALFTVARQLAASPIMLTDDEVERALKLTGPREVVQLVSYTTGRSFFDRITEAAGLQLED